MWVLHLLGISMHSSEKRPQLPSFEGDSFVHRESPLIEHHVPSQLVIVHEKSPIMLRVQEIDRSVRVEHRRVQTREESGARKSASHTIHKYRVWSTRIMSTDGCHGPERPSATLSRSLEADTRLMTPMRVHGERAPRPPSEPHRPRLPNRHYHSA